jgi:hypothetical protein
MWCRLPNVASALSSAEPLECQAVAVQVPKHQGRGGGLGPWALASRCGAESLFLFFDVLRFCLCAQSAAKNICCAAGVVRALLVLLFRAGFLKKAKSFRGVFILESGLMPRSCPAMGSRSSTLPVSENKQLPLFEPTLPKTAPIRCLHKPDEPGARPKDARSSLRR